MRPAPLELTQEEFRSAGHQLVDRIAEFLGEIRSIPVTPAETPTAVRAALGQRDLPEAGADAHALLRNAAELLFSHSLFNGHPRFMGYITSSPAPIGMLADLLASAVNANVGAWKLAPMATEIEAQVIRWIAQFIGYTADCGGLLVSGGNMANITCFLAARTAKAKWNIREQGIAAGERLCIYAGRSAHTWLEKAADMSGFGANAIHWIEGETLDIPALEAQYRLDWKEGYRPFLVVGSAGTVSTGALDPLPEIAAFCKKHDLWFHVDGAYGAFAAAIENAPPEFDGMQLADSVAVDPHKWLYAPLEAGCVLVRDPATLRNAFSYHPPYYTFGVETLNYFDLGPQNSRGFRALKVWLALQHAGAAGYRGMIQDNIRLSGKLYHLAAQHPELQALTHHLSITTLRYAPSGQHTEDYLNRLNQRLLELLEQSGEAFMSNAVIDGKFALRFCIVNFRTSGEDIEVLPELVARLGRQAHTELNRHA